MKLLMTPELLETCAGGIIFTGDSVLAVRDGRKTQTRRIVNWKWLDGANPQFTGYDIGNYCTGVPSSGWVLRSRGGMGCWNDRTRPSKPRYQPGKRYYVKETWCKNSDDYLYQCDDPDLRLVDGDGYGVYRKDGSEASPWRSPMFMPRAAARYVIEVDTVRVQRLHDITEKDAIAEGVRCWVCNGPVDGTSENDCGCFHSRQMARDSFALAWDAINGKRAPWSSNPWIWAINFHLVTK